MPRNHDIAELRRLDVAHHLPAQADWAEIEKLGGSRIITHAEGCYIHDGDGHRILDGMAGLWCVNVGYGREELVEAFSARPNGAPLLAVQWHPEWATDESDDSQTYFRLLGRALRGEL